MQVTRASLARLTPDGDLVPGVAPGGAVLWPFTQNGRFPWRCTSPARLDPINLLVLRADPARVFAALTECGWRRPADGARHRTWIDGAFRTMDDHIALGDRAERVHIRLFGLGGVTLAAAHHEVADRRGRHVVTSWDRARAETAAALEAAGFVRIAPSAVVTPRDLRGAPSDGRAWRLVADEGYASAPDAR